MAKAAGHYDVIVIGGGPSGIMAAGTAAENGARVLLLEKNATLGRKISITGKGRCNVTQAEFDLRALVADYGLQGRFLYSAIHRFGPEDVINFFTSLGVPMKFERGGRVFPESDRAEDIIHALRLFLSRNNVEVLTETPVKGLITRDQKAVGVRLVDGTELFADSVIVATGGLSYPSTGSTGDGFRFANITKHVIVTTMPALVPLTIAESWVKDLQGLSLKNVNLSLWLNGKKISDRFGEMLFTHFGITGPIVLDISKEVLATIPMGVTELRLNLKPALNLKQLDERLIRDFKEHGNKIFKNSLGELLPAKMISLVVYMSGINPDKPANSITKEERQRLVQLLSSLVMTPNGSMGYDLAIVTSGGVSTAEIDPRTMQSKKMANLYFVGEVLDVDGPTGGYNLQAAWSTGRLAGDSASKQYVK